MCPDLNSLPPSRSSSTSPLQPRNLPTSSDPLPTQHSLSGFSPAAPSATMSTANNNQSHTIDIPHRPSRDSRSGMSGSERRRSANLGLSNHNNEPGIDSISSSEHRSSLSHHAIRTSSPSSFGGGSVIATGDPHHQRAPSLGELHQELEQEQEAQVNRLLQMIRSQQTQLQQLQQQQPSAAQGTAIDDSAPSSERSSLPHIPPLPNVPPLPAAGNRTSFQGPSSLSSQAASPSLRPLVDSPRGPEEWITGASESPARRGSRDEGAFYQAEAAMLTRENQILRQRIRDLERQVSEMNTSSLPTASGADSHTSTAVESAEDSTDKT